MTMADIYRGSAVTNKGGTHIQRSLGVKRGDESVIDQTSDPSIIREEITQNYSPKKQAASI